MTDLISDLYKDAYGFRPANEYLRNYASLSKEEQQEEDAYLQNIVDRSIEEERAQREHSYNVWFNSVSQIATSNNVSLGTAIRWDMEAHDATMGGELDVGYYCYKTGIGYENETFIKQEIAIS